MARFAVFLRGMNLGKRRITNGELVACFEQLGFTAVEAFLASGNVVLDAKSGGASLERRVERGLSKALNYDVPTFVRSGAAVRAIAGATPFAKRGEGNRRGKLQVALLGGPPDRGGLREVASLDTDDDWLHVEGAELYWWPRGGLSESELDLKALAKALGPMTIRTHRTLDRMATKFFPA